MYEILIIVESKNIFVDILYSNDTRNTTTTSKHTYKFETEMIDNE